MGAAFTKGSGLHPATIIKLENKTGRSERVCFQRLGYWMPTSCTGHDVQAFSNMIIDEQRQAILISGESGAGKTESAKMVRS